MALDFYAWDHVSEIFYSLRLLSISLFALMKCGVGRTMGN